MLSRCVAVIASTQTRLPTALLISQATTRCRTQVRSRGKNEEYVSSYSFPEAPLFLTVRPASDRAGSSRGEKEKRRIAYILHLTKEWNPKYGGDMVWMNPAYHFHPSFNSMTFFAVSESSWHFVSPVASTCPPTMKRLAFSGWWTSVNLRQADAIESKKNDQLRFSTFATVVEGQTGRSIPHLEAYEKLEGLWPKLAS
jgi:hypothetical protein